MQIALERQAAGRAVLLIDADRQGSAQKVMTMRAESGHRPLTCTSNWPTGRLLRAQLAPLAEQHDDTVIDAGGHDSEALRVAMLRSDLLVVPVQPRALNAWELEVMAGMVVTGRQGASGRRGPPAAPRAGRALPRRSGRQPG